MWGLKAARDDLPQAPDRHVDTYPPGTCTPS